MRVGEDLQKEPIYQWTKKLTKLFNEKCVDGEPIEIQLKAITEAPLPDNLPVAAAVRTKLLFMLAVVQPRFGALMDSLPGMENMIYLASLEDR